MDERQFVEISAVEMNVGIVWMVQTPKYMAEAGDLIEVASEGRILTGKVLATMTCFTDSDEYAMAQAVAGKGGIRRAKALLKRKDLTYEEDSKMLT